HNCGMYKAHKFSDIGSGWLVTWPQVVWLALPRSSLSTRSTMLVHVSPTTQSPPLNRVVAVNSTVSLTSIERLLLPMASQASTVVSDHLFLVLLSTVACTLACTTPLNQSSWSVRLRVTFWPPSCSAGVLPLALVLLPILSTPFVVV